MSETYSYDLAYCPKCKSFGDYYVKTKMIKVKCDLGEYSCRRDTAKCERCNTEVTVEKISRGNAFFREQAFSRAFCRGYN